MNWWVLEDPSFVCSGVHVFVLSLSRSMQVHLFLMNDCSSLVRMFSLDPWTWIFLDVVRNSTYLIPWKKVKEFSLKGSFLHFYNKASLLLVVLINFLLNSNTAKTNPESEEATVKNRHLSWNSYSERTHEQAIIYCNKDLLSWFSNVCLSNASVRWQKDLSTAHRRGIISFDNILLTLRLHSWRMNALLTSFFL